MRQYIGRGVIRGLLVATGLLAAQSLASAQAPAWNGQQPDGQRAVQGPVQGPVQSPYPSAPGQYPGAQGNYPGQPGPQPNQPVGPQLPSLQRRPARQELPPWFPLSQEKQIEVDRVLEAWQQRSNEVKSFECSFTRWEYDAIFVDIKNPSKARFTDRGILKYAAPDKGLFKVEVDKTEDPQGQREEQWICDGKSIFEFNRQKKQLIEHLLPPELRGKGIADGPLPFLFGAEAEKLRNRYYLCIITPPDTKGEIWLEGWPRFQQDKANFHHVQLILLAKGMVPSAMQIYSPNGQDRTVYKFDDVLINDPWRQLKGNPFIAHTPSGWTRIVDGPQRAPAQANRVPLGMGR